MTSLSREVTSLSRWWPEISTLFSQRYSLTANDWRKKMCKTYIFKAWKSPITEPNYNGVRKISSGVCIRPPRPYFWHRGTFSNISHSLKWQDPGQNCSLVPINVYFKVSPVLFSRAYIPVVHTELLLKPLLNLIWLPSEYIYIELDCRYFLRGALRMQFISAFR